jgi:hypothetical protein
MEGLQQGGYYVCPICDIRGQSVSFGKTHNVVFCKDHSRAALLRTEEQVL